jgi:DNA polymerase III subunit epsilon
MYSIVDIETTGGSAKGNKIIEISIFCFDGKKVVDEYHSLINPGTRVPGFITSLTGITEEMLEYAPSFEQVAREIEDFTADSIFVAHNVNFDFTFIRTEFANIGKKFERNKLCTVRTSRKIFPGLPSYSLGNLCGSLGIKIKDRHRAKGDAEATVKLLKLLLKNDKEEFISKSLKKNSRETLLPANLPREQFDALPEEPGVYFFHDHNGKVIYVGKAINIKKRVVSHFSAKQTSKQSQNFIKDMHGLSFELSGNELIALLMESYYIKKHWPIYNRTQKKVAQNAAMYQYEDMEGYLRLSVGNTLKHQKPLLSFRYESDAREFLLDKVTEYKLCPKRCGLQKVCDDCEVCHEGIAPDLYNVNVRTAINSFMDSGRSYMIRGAGRSIDEYSVVLVEHGKYLGYGFIPDSAQIMRVDDVKEYLNGHWDNRDIQKILESHQRSSPESIKFLAAEVSSNYKTSMVI